MQNTYKNDVERDLYLRKVALGEIEGEMTGYPSIDKPWLKYYPKDAEKLLFLKKQHINLFMISRRITGNILH